MTLHGLIVLILWLGGALVSWRPMLRMCDMRDVDWDELIFIAGAVSLGALLWPIVWSTVLIQQRWTPEEFARVLGGEGRSAKRERKLRAQRDEIARLERELEIERRGGTTS